MPQPGTCAGATSGRTNYGSSVLISPQRREWAEMRNDPSGFVPRKCEYDANKKTRHAGDCVATQTGHDKGWDGARPPLATDFRAQSSLCSLSDRLSSAGVCPMVCLAKKKIGHRRLPSAPSAPSAPLRGFGVRTCDRIPCCHQGVCRPRPAAQPDRNARFVDKPHGTTVDRGAASFDVKAST